ncbi:winged helix-turn-helix domain-containing protein [Tahibacter soli]|uniref:Winged helix-turn-helix domain-containing protein n=1 Tax=Tahibacter soli TaxID=2983605 RepID=A0A9X4BIF4_9GAMM|nr:winged helix-turn-helix domain-containing protein [Tahibacter soli]MDC8013901.1 winged helix-turn-helix domain-containing protein [Tahibacter soli]
MTSSGNSIASRFRLGDWLVVPDECALEGPAGKTTIEPKLMTVLVTLCERADETISAEQLLIECWRGTFYGDNPVHKSIAQLRRALGDSATEPRYIATIRKRGYRIVAPVTFPERYSANVAALPRWTTGSPYVGLGAFDAGHAQVFFGRSRAQAWVLGRLRERVDEGCGFVLVLAPSGSGKSSLVRAGVLPLLTQPGGFDGCTALAVSEVDAMRVGNDAYGALADAMLGWQVDDEALFLPGERAFLVDSLAGDRALVVATIEERLSRRRPRRDGDGHRVLVIVVDQLERVFASGTAPLAELDRLFAALRDLLAGQRVAAFALCRNDFYPRVAEVPALVELKSDNGVFDLPLLAAGELAQIIRAPALAAGLRFEHDESTSLRLDDVLRDDAVRQPQSLPLLQHALLEIYQRRSVSGVLSFEAYRAIGGLEGALAQRAEMIFNGLPASAQRRLPELLRTMVALGPDEGLPVGRRVAWADVADADTRALAQGFVEQRLFVSDLTGGVPGFAAAHESLFRNWPRARDWVAENRRLLLARSRVSAAYRRWHSEGRRRDFLLPPGTQLDDARALIGDRHVALDADVRRYVDESIARWRRQRRVRYAAVVAVLVLGLAAGTAGVIAALARAEADQRRVQAEGLVGFMLGELTERLRGLGKLDVLDSVGNEAMRYLVSLPQDDGNATTQLLRIRASRQIGEIRLSRAEPTAADAFAHARDLAESLAAREPDNADAWLELGNAAFWLGQIPFQKNDYAATAQHWQRYLDAARRLVALKPDDAKARLELSYAQNNLATLDYRTSRMASARERFDESAQLKRRVLASTPDDAVVADLADTLTWIGRVDEAETALETAEKHYQEALDALSSLRARQPDDLRWRYRESIARMHVARLALMRGDLAGSIDGYSRAREVLIELSRSDPSNAVWSHAGALAAVNAATAKELAGDRGAAEALTREALAEIGAVIERGSRSTDYLRLRQMAAFRIAQIRRAAGAAKADEEFDALVDTLTTEAASASPQTTAALANVLTSRAEYAAHAGKAQIVQQDSQRAIDLLAPVAASNEAVVLDARMRALSLLGRNNEARTLAVRLEAAGFRHPDHIRFLTDHPLGASEHD